MRILLTLLGIAASLIFAGCETTSTEEASSAPASNFGTRATQGDGIYYLQHRLLPRWVRQPGGAFFDDLSRGVPQQLVSSATDLVDEDYASQIELTVVEPDQIYVLTFPEPYRSPLCYHVAIVKTEDNLRYYTLEKTAAFGLEDDYAMFCGWSNGSHLNFGARDYKDLESFANELRGLSGSEEAGAAFTPGNSAN